MFASVPTFVWVILGLALAPAAIWGLIALTGLAAAAVAFIFPAFAGFVGGILRGIMERVVGVVVNTVAAFGSKPLPPDFPEHLVNKDAKGGDAE